MVWLWSGVQVGACGFSSRILPGFYPISLVRLDGEEGELLRDSRGLCVPCRPGQSTHTHTHTDSYRQLDIVTVLNAKC